MVLDKKQTTVAYRCNRCGAGVMGIIDVFTLSAPMIKLKCDCGGSEMTVIKQEDGKVRLSEPVSLMARIVGSFSIPIQNRLYDDFA